MWKPGRKREFAEPRRAQEVNIEMDFKINRMGEHAVD
jgi:hypothetical protein